MRMRPLPDMATYILELYVRKLIGDNTMLYIRRYELEELDWEESDITR